ncbi:MAG: response regulator transcription factor, partial [Planctomycetota bacterium]
LLSAYVRDRYLDAAYESGAWGYLSKSDSPDFVVEGIRSVARGELAFSREIEERSALARHGSGDAERRSAARAQPESGKPEHGEARSRLDLLTRREQQILRMIARGMSRTGIATEISRSPMTVDNHRKSIMKKLGINDRAELVRYAIAEGIVEV